ncbi:MAG: hypothetical protein ABIB79_00805 [archaeon]
MKIEIDYNPSPKDTFFISIGINDNEAISFDWTSKGHRVIKQVLIEKKPFPEYKKPTAEWDAMIINNLKFVKRYHVKWIDKGKKDWVNNEIWETIWSKPISEKTKDKLLHYSHLISDNYKDLDKFPKELKEFEDFLSKEISRYKIGLIYSPSSFSLGSSSPSRENPKSKILKTISNKTINNK